MMRRIAAAALPVRCAVGMLLTTQRARLSMTAAADPFAKFASGLMRCNQKCFDRVADDLAGRGLPAGAAVLDIGASAGVVVPKLLSARETPLGKASLLQYIAGNSLRRQRHVPNAL